MASLVVGCSPAPKSTLAVERTEEGKARVLIAPCPEYDALQFSIFSKGGSVGFHSWAISNNAMRGQLAEIELFSAPTGWSVTEEGLKSIDAAESYTIHLDGSVRGRGLDGKISFTPDRFEALKPGQVLVRDGKGAKTVKKSEFMKKDSDRCTPD
ncbi:hypothetical protein [Streptomyces sp. NPDC127112]|uniref:hypothetical protein n=1 Tax=Streptomyces sp. NPDC127112 TaxID=3345364 RepID=UPI0036280012